MDNPGAKLHPIPDTRARTGRYIAIAIVGALHVVAIWAFASGLAITLVKTVPKLIEAKIVQTPPPKEKPPPQPQVKLQAAPKIQAYIPPPQINIQQPPPPAPVQQVQRVTPPPPAPPPPAQPITPPAPQAPAIPDTAPAGIESTHTTPPYPPVARRLGKEGTVLLRISIAASGAVTDATVVNSSGNSELDEAAVNWVKSHWRYKPATHSGQPVAGTVEAAVKFTLQNA